MKRAYRVFGEGIWAVADQAMFAGSNFFLNLLLVRWLGEEAYGAFGVAYAIFLFVSLAFTALVIDPMLVFGANRWHSTLRAYLRRVLTVLVKMALVSSVVFVVLSQVVGIIDESGALEGPVLTLSWVGPLVLLQWTLRRVCYLMNLARLAAAAGTVYFAVVTGSALGVNEVVGMSPSFALDVIALGSVVSAAFLGWRLHVRLKQEPPTNVDIVPTLPDVQRVHWGYGRWLWVSSILDWVAGDMLYLVLASRHGLAAAGLLRAAFNLMMPALHALGALSVVAVPRFVRTLRSGVSSRQVLAWWGAMAGLALLYSGVIVALADPILRLAYGDAFMGIKAIVLVLAVLPVAAATHGALGTILRAMERSRDLLISTMAMVVVAASLGIVLTSNFGAMGAAIAMVFTSFVSAAAVAWRLRIAMSVGKRALG